MADNLQGGLVVTPLKSGMVVRLEALHPDTGAAVAGVTISDVVISGEAITDATTLFIETGPPRLIPGPPG
jgi:hypothetical protein